VRRIAPYLLAALCAACALPPVAVTPDAPPAPVVVVPEPEPEPPPEPVSPAPPSVPVAPPAPPQPDESKQLAELVAAAHRFAAMSPEEQKRDYNSASQLFARERTMTNRLRLALILSTPASALQDDVRAVGLLEGLPAGGGPLRQFAALLQAQVGDRVRATRRAEQLKEQLDALREVERSIIERGGAGAPRKP
jgi:hypothetical protein